MKDLRTPGKIRTFNVNLIGVALCQLSYRSVAKSTNQAGIIHFYLLLSTWLRPLDLFRVYSATNLNYFRFPT